MAPDTEVTGNKARKRILYVITKANWGGAQRYVFDLATASRDAGHEVLVVSGTDGELRTRLEEAGIRSVMLPMQNKASFAALAKAYRALLPLLRQERPDIVHLNSSLAGVAGAYAARRAGIQHVIFTAHAWAFNEDRPRFQKILIALFHGATVLLCDRTICVSEALARDMQWLPFVQDRISVIPNGVDAVSFLSRTEARATIAPDNTAPFWIGSIAELHPTKQLHVLIEAFASIKDAYPGTALVLMGEGEERERLEALITERGLSERVRLCGHVENAASYLEALDMFVLPSRSEGLGYVLLEAGLASLPVVASDVGGIPEIVRPHESGMLVPSGDSAALADALALLIPNEALRDTLGNALRERVTRIFPRSRMVRETLALYGEA